MVIEIQTWGVDNSSLDETKWYIYGDFWLRFFEHPQGYGFSILNQEFYTDYWYDYKQELQNV